jgi:SAM-dependent methyltransferase
MDVAHLSSLRGDFDAIVMVDVLEHIDKPRRVLIEVYRLLKPGGLLYMSTPNRFSLFNAMCDPHYSLPFLSLLSRKSVRKIIADILHWHGANKTDFPQLLSLWALHDIFSSTGFRWRFVNTRVIAFAMDCPHSLWNRPVHLTLFSLAQRWGIVKLIDHFLTDKFDNFNKWLNSTWYVIAEKS